MDSLDKVGDARSLAQVIVEAGREPLLVLDKDLKVLAASDSFHKAFQIAASETTRQSLLTMGGGAWNIQALSELLGRAMTEGEPIEGVAFTHVFPRLGLRNFLLYARRVQFDERGHTTVLLSFEDITSRLAIEADKDRLQIQTDQLLKKEHILLEEMQHRIVNSLQIIASILMLKARSVTSEETRGQLQDAHRRVMSVAEVQKYLHTASGEDKIDIGPYLTNLCASLASSMIDEGCDTKLRVQCFGGTAISADAVSLGLIVTELVINALKYAFPNGRSSALVTVHYEAKDGNWMLSVEDNGVGKNTDTALRPKSGLGTTLVAALAHQLNAAVETKSDTDGMRVSVTHSAAPPAAGFTASGELAGA